MTANIDFDPTCQFYVNEAYELTLRGKNWKIVETYNSYILYDGDEPIKGFDTIKEALLYISTYIRD